MTSLDFGAIHSAKNFRTFTAFNEYFNFSGRKYRLIDASSVRGKQTFKVQSSASKPNIPLNILKVISCATLIIPLIMAIGRMIMHRKFSLIIEKGHPHTYAHAVNQPAPPNENHLKGQSVYPLNSQGSSQTPNQTIPTSITPSSILNTTGAEVPLPIEKSDPKFKTANSQEDKAREDVIHQFKTSALQALQQKQVQGSPRLDFNLSAEQEDILMQADAKKKGAANTWPSGVKVNRGGVNCVIFLDCAPHFVFKPMDSEKSAKEYLETVSKARQVVEQENLYLIHIPETRIIQVQGKFFIVQEKANLLSSTFRGQRGVYSYGWNDGEMHDYMRTLFSQLVHFIVKTGFSDVKYDNIPLNSDGRVSLIDLDASSAVVGLTKGMGKDVRGGLLNYIPEAFLTHFLDLAQNLLGSMVDTGAQGLMNAVAERAKKRTKRVQDYSRFHQTNAITTPSQGIVRIPSLTFKDHRMDSLCDTLIDLINDQLQKDKNNFSLDVGRTIFIENNIKTTLFKRAQDLWEHTIEYMPLLSRSSVTNYQQVLHEILEAMKNAGYIFGFKVRGDLHFIKVKI